MLKHLNIMEGASRGGLLVWGVMPVALSEVAHFVPICNGCVHTIYTDEQEAEADRLCDVMSSPENMQYDISYLFTFAGDCDTNKLRVYSTYAVSGGLDYDTAMTLADYYIQRAEMASDRNTLMILHKNMLKTYTRMVAEKRSNNAESALVNKVRIYVEGHLTEKISGQALAEALGLNRAYLSAQFKRETAIELNEYIHRMKIDEASRLLVVTDMPIAAVATRLGFSSQSYFQSIFKKVTGMNPSEYREVSVLEI